MKTTLKRIALALAALFIVGVVGASVWVLGQTRAFDRAMARTHDFPVPPVVRSTDPTVIARGEHLARSLGGCIACHGENLAGGKVEDLGPLGRIVHANLTPGKNGVLGAYSDGELARLLRHGVKRDGRSAHLMPVDEFSWWSEEDRVALISFLRTLPPVDGEPAAVSFTSMAKVLDRMGSVPIEAVRFVDHTAPPTRMVPAPTKEYGALLATMCRGCHGDKHMAGGPIPGAPPDIAAPLNLTPHETGLAGWTYDDFEKVIRSGQRKSGAPLNAFMPVTSLQNMNDVERRALWEYLASLPPMPYGAR